MSQKKALLVGINYKGTDSELKGCINDVMNMQSYLFKQGFAQKDITVITDDTTIKPTKSVILMELLRLILSGAPTLVFHYSGHGSHQRDLSGEEADGEDEGLCPLDYDQKGLILDDELRGLLQCLPETSRLTCILDCCHSGSGMDLSYNVYERAGRFYALKEGSLPDTRGQVICITGCQDVQTSADAVIGGQAQGALTAGLLQSLLKRPTLDQLLIQVRDFMTKNKYQQIPQMACGQAIVLSRERLF